jgi:hypothetical protein
MKTIILTDLKESKVLAEMKTEYVLYWVSFIKTYFIVGFNKSVFYENANLYYILDEKAERNFKIEITEA